MVERHSSHFRHKFGDMMNATVVLPCAVEEEAPKAPVANFKPSLHDQRPPKGRLKRSPGCGKRPEAVVGSLGTPVSYTHLRAHETSAHL
eukprot:1995203-Alexandrium_andersonii.AAC.1